MSQITVKELERKVDEWHTKKKQIEELEEIVSKHQTELNEIGFDLMNMMTELNLEKFEGTLGKVRIHEDEYITLPDDEFKRAEFIQYMKDNGEWDQFATIHHQKLQSWHKAKREEHGELFMAPGLDLPKIRKSIRKTR